MTVKDLIRKLKKLPQDAKLYRYNYMDYLVEVEDDDFYFCPNSVNFKHHHYECDCDEEGYKTYKIVENGEINAVIE